MTPPSASLAEFIESPESFQHKLERFDPGMVWLDRDNRVMAMNGVATRVLGARVGEVVGQEVLQLHPEKSRSKIELLMETARCPAESPPPMTMLINIPDRMLLIKVSKMYGADEAVGTCMVFFDLTDVIMQPQRSEAGADLLRQLLKLPVYKHNRVLLLDLDEVVHLKAEGHYTTVLTDSQEYLCNLSLSDLERRLDATEFVRVHRSHMINVRYAAAFEKVQEQCIIVLAAETEVRVPVSRSNVQKLKSMFGLA